MNKGDREQLARTIGALWRFFDHLRIALEADPPNVELALTMIRAYELAAGRDEDEV